MGVLRFEGIWRTFGGNGGGGREIEDWEVFRRWKIERNIHRRMKMGSGMDKKMKDLILKAFWVEEPTLSPTDWVDRI